jgi:phosphate uptake regulator
MAASVAEMIRLAVSAYEDRSTAPIQQMSRTRAEATARAAALMEWLTGAMKADPAAVEPGLGLFAAVQSLHRIADHATHLVEEVVDLTGGSNLRFQSGHLDPVVSEAAYANHGS